MFKQIGLSKLQRYDRANAGKCSPNRLIESPQTLPQSQILTLPIHGPPQKRMRREKEADKIIHRVRNEVMGRCRDKNTLRSQIDAARGDLRAAEHATAMNVRFLGQIKAKISHHKRLLDHATSDISAMRSHLRELNVAKPEDHFSKSLETLMHILDDTHKSVDTKKGLLLLESSQLSLVSLTIDADLVSLNKAISEDEQCILQHLSQKDDCHEELVSTQAATKALIGDINVVADACSTVVSDIDVQESAIHEANGIVTSLKEKCTEMEAKLASICTATDKEADSLKAKVSEVRLELGRTKHRASDLERDNTQADARLTAIKCDEAAILAEASDSEKHLNSLEGTLRITEERKSQTNMSLEALKQDVAIWEDKCDKTKARTMDAISSHDAAMKHTQALLSDYFESHEYEQELAWEIAQVEVGTKQEIELLGSDVANSKHALSNMKDAILKAEEGTSKLTKEHESLMDELNVGRDVVLQVKTQSERILIPTDGEPAVCLKTLNADLSEISSTIVDEMTKLIEARASDDAYISKKLTLALDAEYHRAAEAEVIAKAKAEHTRIGMDSVLGEIENLHMQMLKLRTPGALLFPKLYSSRKHVIDTLETQVSNMQKRGSDPGIIKDTNPIPQKSGLLCRSRSQSAKSDRGCDWFTDEGISFGIFNA